MSPTSRAAAHRKVARAVASGKLRNPGTCEKCGRSTPTDAHHNDYALPLQVVWLCRSCHRRSHGGSGRPRILINSQQILRALTESNGDIEDAAKWLDVVLGVEISGRTLRRRMKDYGIKAVVTRQFTEEAA